MKYKNQDVRLTGLHYIYKESRALIRLKSKNFSGFLQSRWMGREIEPYASLLLTFFIFSSFVEFVLYQLRSLCSSKQRVVSNVASCKDN